MFNECETCFIKDRCPIYKGEIPKPDKQGCPHIFKIRKAMEMSNVPAKYKNTLFKDFKVYSYNKHIYQTFKTLVENLTPDGNDFFNIILTGKETGTGKTLAGCALLNEYIIKKYGYFNWDIPLAMYTDFSSLMKRIKNSIDHPDEELKFYIDSLKQCSFLVIDDVGATRISDYVRDEAYVIFNERNLNARSTMIISNYPTDFLASDNSLSKRIMSRLHENGIRLSIVGGEDRRVLG